MKKWAVFSSRERAIALTIALLFAFAATATSLTLRVSTRPPKKLPPLTFHADIPARPLTTYQDSLATTLPADAKELPSKCQPEVGNWVSQENQNSGVALTTSDWKSLRLYQQSGSVLWLDKASVTCGERIGIHASLFPVKPDGSLDKTARTFEVLRIGWYNGSGARMMWNSGPIKLKRQTIPVLKNLNRMVETRWPVSASFEVGADWTPGLYIVTSINKSGRIENLAPFVLRSSQSDSKLVLIHSTLTWAAYNSFGGHSTYTATRGGEDERSKVASFDRPYAGSAISHIERDAISFVQYLESTGLNIDHTTDVDLSNAPSSISQYNGIVFSGHPEYMTRNEFDSIVAARNSGKNIAFMGSNSAYWQSRLAPSPRGEDRHLIIYKNPLIDPETAWNKVSIEFGDARVNTPPSLLTGEVTAGVHVTGALLPAQIPHWLNIPAGESLSGWSPNSEIDSMATGPATPPNMHLLFSGKFRLANSKAAPFKSTRSLTAQTIWFVAPSGSATFVTGINYWPCEVSPTCAESTVPETTRGLLQSITSQVLTLWQTQSVGKSLK